MKSLEVHKKLFVSNFEILWIKSGIKKVRLGPDFLDLH